MTTLTAWLRYAGKAIATAAGGAAQLIAAGTLHGTALEVARIVLIVATVAGVYRIKNGRRPGSRSAAIEQRLAEIRGHADTLRKSGPSSGAARH